MLSFSLIFYRGHRSIKHIRFDSVDNPPVFYSIDVGDAEAELMQRASLVIWLTNERSEELDSLLLASNADDASVSLLRYSHRRGIREDDFLTFEHFAVFTDDELRHLNSLGYDTGVLERFGGS